MTKKELNLIRRAAYDAWCATSDAQEFLCSSYEHCSCWRISEGQQQALVTTYYDAQINDETLKAYGFSCQANVRRLFEVNRKTKALIPCGWEPWAGEST